MYFLCSEGDVWLHLQGGVEKVLFLIELPLLAEPLYMSFFQQHAAGLCSGIEQRVGQV